METLDELASDYGDTKAAGYSRSIQNFEFIMTLVAVEDALSKLVNLSKLLQKKNCDLLYIFYYPLLMQLVDQHKHN